MTDTRIAGTASPDAGAHPSAEAAGRGPSAFVPSPEQTAVITHPLEPLRVAAGAGTGKTTTVAHRIAHLVRAHGIEPEQVLGITFTNKAAEELADRVRGVLAGSTDPGRDVEVHTYHGFAAQLLGEFGALVGVERDAPVVTPTFTRQMLSTIIRSVRLPHLDTTWRGVVDWVRRLSALMGDHLVEPSDLQIPDDLAPPWAVRKDLLTVVERYRAEKQRLGVVDYADLLHAAHRLVTEHGWVAERVRSRFRAVVLDEYQDTNPAQRLLLAEVFGDGFPVTAVGDPDQTIYEWRGASLGNFHRFPVHFPTATGHPATSLSLTINRRSSPQVVDVANAVRRRVDGDPRPPLRPLDDAPDGAVRAAWFGDAVEEADWIAEDIERRHRAGAAWSSIAVLFRKNKDMEIVRDALAARDVPVEVANLGGLLSVPEVVELHSWLRVLDDPEDGAALARLLTGSRHRLGLADVAILATWVRGRRAPGDPDEGAPGFTLLEALDHLDQLTGLRAEARAALSAFVGRYRTLVRDAQGVSLVELCRRILDLTGAWRDVEALGEAGRLSARLNLYRFLDLAEAWSPLEGRPSLTSFLDYLATMEEEPSEELDTARLARAEAVTLLTVHRAKGLEWDTVFVPATYEANFPSGIVGAYDDPASRPESLPYRYRLDREDLPPITEEMDDDERRRLLRRRHESQEWRIAYVAATRARRSLTVTGAHWYGHPEPRQRAAEPSALFELVRDHPGTEIVHLVEQAPVRPDTLGFQAERLPAPDPHFHDGGWQAALRQGSTDPRLVDAEAARLDVQRAYHEHVERFEQLLLDLPEEALEPPPAGIRTSVTGLVTYARCPQRFYWSEVDRLPRRHSPAARRGVDVHRRIELHHRGVMLLEDVVPEAYDLPEDHLAAGDGGHPGGIDPFQVFAASRFASTRPFLVEAPFELRVGGDVTVRGRIDAVYRSDGGAWEVVDFKSGRPTADRAARVQLEAYAVAVDRVAMAAERPTSLTVTFAHLGGGRLAEVSEVVDDSWLSQADERLTELAEGIEAGSFDPTPSPACHRCDFLRFCPAGRAFTRAQSA